MIIIIFNMIIRKQPSMNLIGYMFLLYATDE